jgi:hypothetical protein
LIKKDLVVAVLLTFCLTVLLFQVLPISSQDAGDYDPWYDVNDDGTIDMRDIGGIARKFGTSGTSINKTALLLELQQNLTVLRQEMIALQQWVGREVLDMIYEFNVTIEVRLPQREVISIPAAAFVPEATAATGLGQVWQNQLRNYNADLIATFYAPVQLPHGVNITRFYGLWYDNSSRSVEMGLYICNSTSHSWRISYLESPLKGCPGVGLSHTNEILERIIDNYSSYHLRVDLPPTHIPENWLDYRFYYAIIEYEYPE